MLYGDPGTQPDPERTTAYVLAMVELLDTDTLPAHASRTNYCPECSRELWTPDDFADHVVWRDMEGTTTADLDYDPVVIVACEGYWVIDPATVDMPNPHWGDWREPQD
jgi:hypothetical protein